MEVIWSVLTMLLATSKSFNTLLVVRFFVGKCLLLVGLYVVQVINTGLIRTCGINFLPRNSVRHRELVQGG